jgi:hypothetical protein
MTLALIKPAGWAFGEILTSAQMEALDASQSRGIDGTGGGTYAPSSAIVINGAGLQVNTLLITGALTLTGDTTVGNTHTDTLTVEATSTFSSPVIFNDDVTANNPVSFLGDVTIGEVTFTLQGDAVLGNTAADSLLVNATAEFQAPVTCNDTLDVFGQLTVHSSGKFRALQDVQLGNGASDELDLQGSLVSVLAYSGDGRVPYRDGGVLPDANTTIEASDGQCFQFPGTVAAHRTYTLSTVGATNGDRILFYSGNGAASVRAFDVTVHSPTSGQSITFGAGFALVSALYVFRNGNWNLASATGPSGSF